MATPDPPCIYTRPEGLCPGGPLSDEHDLPAAFGAFRNDLPYQGICRACNERIGRLVDALSHASPEAFRRRQLGVRGRPEHRKKSILHEGTDGLPAIKVVGESVAGTGPVLWEPKGDCDGAPLPQIEYERDDGTRALVPVPETIETPEDLDDLLVRYGLEPARPRRFVCLPGGAERFRALLGVTDAETTLTPYPGEGGTVEVVVEIPIDDRHVRAVAAIGLHVFLKAFPRFSGLEEDFDGIKRFIYLGERGSIQWAVPVHRRPIVTQVANGLPRAVGAHGLRRIRPRARAGTARLLLHGGTPAAHVGCDRLRAEQAPRRRGLPSVCLPRRPGTLGPVRRGTNGDP